MNPKSNQQLRKTIVGELSRVQLYAKDHPYDVTAGDEKDIEHAVDQIMQAFESFHTGEVEKAERKARIEQIKTIEQRLEDLDDANQHISDTAMGCVLFDLKHLQSIESDKS